jgi:hypothetical protein
MQRNDFHKFFFFFFVFVFNQFVLPITPKKLNLQKLPKVEGPILMYTVPLWPPISVKGGQYLPRHMGQKCTDMENMLGNTLGT